MTHGALFNGIAGFPLAAAWAGIHTEWTVEIDEFCNKVSKKHFPDATQYQDIHEARNLPYVDIISGGFPCQPFSLAGKRKGNEDDRALWPQMLRIIREVKPAYVIGENVSGIINLALDDVLTSLEAEGYTTETFVVPACAVGAPHRRNRVWIIAYAKCNRCKGGQSVDRKRTNTTNTFSQKRHVAYSFGQILQGSEFAFFDGEKYATKEKELVGRAITKLPKTQAWNNWPTQSPVCGGNDGLPSRLVRNRAKQLKAYGNAIVPQVAYEIFKAIVQIEAA